MGILISNCIHNLVNEVADLCEQLRFDLIVSYDDEKFSDRTVPLKLFPDLGVCVDEGSQELDLLRKDLVSTLPLLKSANESLMLLVLVE